MKSKTTRRLAAAVLGGLVVLVAGCETGYIQDAARDSLASFLSEVFTTAVNETIGAD